MGELKVNKLKGGTDKITYLAKLVDDIEALESMLEAGAISKGPMHIGAEQEFCLVTDNWMPAPLAQEVLEGIADSHFTTELALYNLEINLDPLVLGGDCFSALKASLDTLLAKGKGSGFPPFRQNIAYGNPANPFRKIHGPQLYDAGGALPSVGPGNSRDPPRPY